MRNKKPRELFDAQDAIDQQRDGLIGKIESQMRQRHNVTRLLGIRWGLKQQKERVKWPMRICPSRCVSPLRN